MTSLTDANRKRLAEIRQETGLTGTEIISCLLDCYDLEDLSFLLARIKRVHDEWFFTPKQLAQLSILDTQLSILLRPMKPL